MFILYQIIPGSSQVRLPTGSPRRDSAALSPLVSRSAALRAIRSSGSCERNAVRRRTYAALIPAQMHRGMHVAIDAACVLRLSYPPLPFAGEA
jgi:hypothetical protein